MNAEPIEQNDLPSHEEMLEAINEACWATDATDRSLVAWQYRRLIGATQ